jgi:hypothetical protein
MPHHATALVVASHQPAKQLLFGHGRARTRMELMVSGCIRRCLPYLPLEKYVIAVIVEILLKRCLYQRVSSSRISPSGSLERPSIVRWPRNALFSKSRTHTRRHAIGDNQHFIGIE